MTFAQNDGEESTSRVRIEKAEKKLRTRVLKNETGEARNKWGRKKWETKQKGKEKKKGDKLPKS